MHAFPTPTLSSRPVLPTAGVQLAGANACVFFSDPRKAQFGHERGSQQSNRQRLHLVGVRGMQVHQHGNSNPTQQFPVSGKIGGFHV